MTNASLGKNVGMTKPVFSVLGDIIRQPPSGSTDTQRLSLVVIRTVSRKDHEVYFPSDRSLP